VNVIRKCLTVSGLLFGGCFAAYGQSSAGLVGRVTDQFGGGIPATITLFSDDRVRTTKANEDGLFEILSLAPQTHNLVFSSPGFFSANIPITDKIPERLSITLRIGEFSGCNVRPGLAKINGIDYMNNGGNPGPSASYEERRDGVYVTGTVGDAWGGPLAGTVVTLTQTAPDAPMVTTQVIIAGAPVTMKSLKETVIGQVTSTDGGKFEFSDLEPGWYTLQAVRDGYWNGSASFFVARENLTRLSRLFLYPKSETHPCSGGAGTPEPSTEDSPLPLTVSPPAQN